MQPNKAQLKVLSNVCANLVTLWIGAVYVAKDMSALTVDLIYASISWYLAVKAEQLLQKI